jgi:hypothetical protein
MPFLSGLSLTLLVRSLVAMVAGGINFSLLFLIVVLQNGETVELLSLTDNILYTQVTSGYCVHFQH